MSADGLKEMRRFSQTLLDLFVRTVEDWQRGNPLTPAQLKDHVQAFLSSADFAGVISEAHKPILRAVATEVLRQRRGDPFRRLVCHPLSEAFHSGALSRVILSNYFSFLHLVMGDEQEELAQRCAEMHDEMKEDPGFTWDQFYDDPRAKEVLWTVLVRVAETFRRFDVRRDWFIGLMQNRMQTVSLGAHAFVPKPRGGSEEVIPFGLEQFNIMLRRLFVPLLRMGGADREAFIAQFGMPPEERLGPVAERVSK